MSGDRTESLRWRVNASKACSWVRDGKDREGAREKTMKNKCWMTVSREEQVTTVEGVKIRICGSENYASQLCDFSLNPKKWDLQELSSTANLGNSKLLSEVC